MRCLNPAWEVLGFACIVHSNVSIKGCQVLECHVCMRATSVITVIIFVPALWLLAMMAPLNGALSPRRAHWMDATIH